MRLVLLLVIGLISLIITLVKNAAGHVSGSERLKSVTVRGETTKIMDKTARGIGWLEQQWEDSKRRGAMDYDNMSSLDKSLYEKAMKELIEERGDERTMIRVLKESNGNEEEAAIRYTRYRMIDLKKGHSPHARSGIINLK